MRLFRQPIDHERRIRQLEQRPPLARAVVSQPTTTPPVSGQIALVSLRMDTVDPVENSFPMVLDVPFAPAAVCIGKVDRLTGMSTPIAPRDNLEGVSIRWRLSNVSTQVVVDFVVGLEPLNSYVLTLLLVKGQP